MRTQNPDGNRQTPVVRHSEDVMDALLVTETAGEGSLDGIASLSSAIPIVGGFISNLASSAASQRRFERLTQALRNLNTDLADVLGELDSDYVKSDEFEELFENLFDQILEERSDDRRRMLLNVLENKALMGESGVSYESVEKIRRLIRELSLEAVVVLDAIAQPAKQSEMNRMIGSFKRTIKDRIFHPSFADIDAAILELTRSGLVKPNISWGANVTAESAAQTATSLTPFGIQFLRYVRAPRNGESS